MKYSDLFSRSVFLLIEILFVHRLNWMKTSLYRLLTQAQMRNFLIVNVITTYNIVIII